MRELAIFVVVAGPNGACKTTAALCLLRDALEAVEYVNADPNAAGLSAFARGWVGGWLPFMHAAGRRSSPSTRAVPWFRQTPDHISGAISIW